jgi:hypothetical protein
MNLNDYDIKIEDIEGHIKRVYRRNLKKPCKICTICPFKKIIVDIMEKNEPGYNHLTADK